MILGIQFYHQPCNYSCKEQICFDYCITIELKTDYVSNLLNEKINARKEGKNILKNEGIQKKKSSRYFYRYNADFYMIYILGKKNRKL